MSLQAVRDQDHRGARGLHEGSPVQQKEDQEEGTAHLKGGIESIEEAEIQDDVQEVCRCDARGGGEGRREGDQEEIQDSKDCNE